MKYKNICVILLSLTACDMHKKYQSENNDYQTNLIQKSNSPSFQLHINKPQCVRSEGGYESNLYCITVFNNARSKNSDNPIPTITMYIRNKKTGLIEMANGQAWLDDDYNMHGFKGKNKDRFYEIDWREEKAHFRIWDASHKKLLEDELVIVGPEDILKDKSTNP